MMSDNTLALLQEMAKLQDKHNTKVHPEWRTMGFDYRRAVWMEAAELMDHLGWRWWRHQIENPAQARLEIIDIWHFGLSMLLLEEGVSENLAQRIRQRFSAPRESAGDLRTIIEHFVHATLSQTSFALEDFLDLCLSARMTFEDLYRQYIGKNVLNQFRQDHGYKAGTYLKQWHGREDNEHLTEIISDLPLASDDYQKRLYAALGERYPGKSAADSQSH